MHACMRACVHARACAWLMFLWELVLRTCGEGIIFDTRCLKDDVHVRVLDAQLISPDQCEQSLQHTVTRASRILDLSHMLAGSSLTVFVRALSFYHWL